jgi:hypothetical protein
VASPASSQWWGGSGGEESARSHGVVHVVAGPEEIENGIK